METSRGQAVTGSRIFLKDAYPYHVSLCTLMKNIYKYIITLALYIICKHLILIMLTTQDN